MGVKLKVSFLLFCLIDTCFLTNSQDLYDLLGVSKDAPLKEIRRAFKALAVLKHPDKNPDDPDATSNFIKLTRAYDILKDVESRKQYDLYGDEGSNVNTNQPFKSYSYYKNEFGIYDDDPLIVTLSKADYDINVLDENQAWWVNFYSPACHHCHVLAPTWRRLAQELEGVVRIAAVNCEDDYILCQQLSIAAYPTLLYYEKDAHLYDGEMYRGHKQFEEMQDFLLSKLRVNVEQIDEENWEIVKDRHWLLCLCGSAHGCPEPQMQIKLAAVFEGLIQVGVVNDYKLCEKLSETYVTQPVVLYLVSGEEIKLHVIAGSDKREFVDSVLSFLPSPPHLDEKRFGEIRSELRITKQENQEEVVRPWLICFYLGAATELNLQLKRLPTVIPNINIGLIHCGKNSGLCQALHVSRYPTWGLLKSGGAFELHHGRDVLHEVTDFARDGSKATNLHALSPADFKGIKDDPTQPWFIDWYAPWCPPCRRLMPQIRKVSQRFTPNQIKFGTIDCTMHQTLCTSENIRSYPTTMILQKEKKQYYHGALSEQDIVEYIEEALNPSVVTLTQENFVKLMRKPVSEIWLVDYYAPWCGPCQRLMPVWRALAREMKKFWNENITIASVDCVAEAELCQSQNINSYPMIRLYPRESYGMNSVAMYTGHRDLMNLKSWIFAFLPTKVVSLSSDLIKKKIMKKNLKTPWLVDFYAPWCDHCIDFEPKFSAIAEELDGTVKAGKLDCQAERNFCIEMRVTSYPTLRLYISKNKFYTIDTFNSDHIISETRRIIEANGHYEHDEL